MNQDYQGGAGVFDDEGMRGRLSDLISAALKAAIDAGDLPDFEQADLGVERTSDESKGDWTSTVAMRSAKLAHRAPRAVADAVIAHMQPDPSIASVEVAGPGFINFRLTDAARTAVFGQVLAEGADFGRSNGGAGRKVDVEFVSANPVGPMHVGHGRWAALGDSLCRMMEFAGWDVTREFYINDAGSQMDVFARSIDKRYRQIAELVAAGATTEGACAALEADRVAMLDDAEGDHPELHPLSNDFVGELGPDSYGGAYIVDAARTFFDADGTSYLDLPAEERLLRFRESGYAMMLGNIKDVLHRCRCDFDVWFSERTLHSSADGAPTAIERAFKRLSDDGYLYRKDDALWFRSTDFGDDKDRVLVKGDGAYTYFSADIAYHANKFDRGFDRCIDIWGADHHGYVQRMKASVAAFGHDGGLDVLLGQLVNLLRNGEPVRMSKRKGTMVTFEELLDEVGCDAARFILLSRSSDQEIDFDIEKAKTQDSDNPVYYVQYAHARICSILRRAAGDELAGDMDEVARRVVGEDVDLSLLTDPSEVALARTIAGFGDLVAGCARDLAPHRLTYYVVDLAAAFHGFYTNCHVLTDDVELTRARLAACDATRRVLASALALMGVDAPQRMDRNE